MKNRIIVALMAVMLTSTAAHAEHKLLVTEVLDQKQIEAQAKFEYTDGLQIGKTKVKDSTESNYSLGVGLGHGLEVTASIPYLFTGHEEELGEESEKRDGIGDFALEAKYRLLGGEEEKYAVVTGLGLKFDTASKKHAAGTGTTDVSPFIAASANLGHHYIPYAIYRATLRNHDEANTHTLSVGLEKELNNTFTLDAKIDANFNTRTDTVDANENLVFELSSYIQAAHNFYILPSVAYLKSTDVKDRTLDVTATSVDGYRLGLSFYYLY